MTLILKKATRKQVKLRLNISAPSGAGKTYSALKMAKGLCGDWTKIAVIDTENGSASLYSDLGEFSVIDLTPPFSPEKYTEALQLCEQSGMEVCIIDSSSHEWTTLLEQNETLAQTSFRGNTWAAWSKSTPRHDRFVNSVLHSNMHVITCTRSKTETIQEGGKVKKVGMKDLQRDGWEYELTISLNLDRDTHLATPSKDRTNLFDGKQPFLITEKTGEQIANWCNSGESELQVAINEMEIVSSLEDLKTVWSKYKSLQTNKEFITMKDKAKEKLTIKPENNE
jgi:AAA domain